jgi:hypothetical protein
MDYVICARNIKADKTFGNEPAPSSYLVLEEDAAPKATPDQVRGPRLTNYSSRHDGVLGLSNFKRAGVAPRAGRIGLPDDTCGHAVNVDCTDYYASIPAAQPVIGSREHSWHIGDPVFTQHMIDTMNGVDRASSGTRVTLAENRFKMKRP